MLCWVGVGKTTVGRLLAGRLARPFWDNDEALAHATGLSAATFQRERGQSALHAIEDSLLREALGAREPTVLAAAASVVLDPQVLAGAVTVWLRSSAEREARNIARSGQRHRPLGADAVVALRSLSAARQSLYADVADVAIDAASDPVTTCDAVSVALAAAAAP